MIDWETGDHTPERVQRGALLVQLDPPMAQWAGRHIHFTARQIAMLFHLCKRGSMSNLAAQIIGGGKDTGAEVIRVQISQIRQRLPSNMHILAVRDWGYKLFIEEDLTMLKNAIVEAAQDHDEKQPAILLQRVDGNPNFRIVGPHSDPLLMLAMLNDATATVLKQIAAASAAKPAAEDAKAPPPSGED